MISVNPGHFETPWELVQMRMAIPLCLLVTGLAGVSLALAGCKGAEPVSSAGTPAVAPANAGVAEPSEAPTANPQPAPAQQWAMPNLVGAGLQTAQNQIQALTGNPIFITFSHDASGRSRSQVLDSNWKVCSQNVAPGSPFIATTRIDFGAVKLAEKCP